MGLVCSWLLFSGLEGHSNQLFNKDPTQVKYQELDDVVTPPYAGVHMGSVENTSQYNTHNKCRWKEKQVENAPQKENTGVTSKYESRQLGIPFKGLCNLRKNM